MLQVKKNKSTSLFYGVLEELLRRGIFFNSTCLPPPSIYPKAVNNTVSNIKGAKILKSCFGLHSNGVYKYCLPYCS